MCFFYTKLLKLPFSSSYITLHYNALATILNIIFKLRSFAIQNIALQIWLSQPIVFDFPLKDKPINYIPKKIIYLRKIPTRLPHLYPYQSHDILSMIQNPHFEWFNSSKFKLPIYNYMNYFIDTTLCPLIKTTTSHKCMMYTKFEKHFKLVNPILANIIEMLIKIKETRSVQFHCDRCN